jgi:hypothetical protein
MRDLRNMEVLTQQGPSCGTTSLAMIVRFLTGDNALTPADIDREIRRLPAMFSAPLDLMAYARCKGLRAEEYNSGSLQQLEDLVSRGIPLMALLDLTPDNALDFDQWHWVVVVAVTETGTGKTLTINNPWGRQEAWEAEKFLKEWAHLHMLGLTFGYNNYYIAVGTAADDLPVSRAGGVFAANAAIKGLADVLNGFAIMKNERSPAGLGRLLWGVLRLLFGAGAILVDNLRRLFGFTSRNSVRNAAT